MPKKEKYTTHSDAEDSSVQLRPILGVRPGLYLSVLYGAAALVVLFFLLVYPGLHRRGVYVSFSTLPEKATITVDGKYSGTSPCTIFVQHGNRHIEISKPFHDPVAFDRVIEGRIFFTLFVPDRIPEKKLLTLSKPYEFVQWSLGDFQKNPDIPQIISDTSIALTAVNPRSIMYDYLDNCIQYVTNESQIREIVYAISIISTSNNFINQTSLANIANNIIHIKQKYDNFPSWLLLSLSRSNAKRVAQNEWISNYLSTYRDNIAKYYQGSLPFTASSDSPGNTISVQNALFHSIPRGELVLGKDDNIESFGKSIDSLLPHPISIKTFYLGETEVTNRQFRLFLDENPDWAPQNMAALIKKTLVTDGYLADWSDGKIPSGRDDYPISSVSYYASLAYCEWLTKRIQTALPGYVARLPTEAEWEWAARGGLRGMPYPLGEKPGSAIFFTKGTTGPSKAGSSEPNRYGLRDMLGNVWEWCFDSFAPSVYLLSSFDLETNATLTFSVPAGPDKVVRGGSWNNQRELIKVFTRGSQPVDWCTPYLGFRVALSRR